MQLTVALARCDDAPAGNRVATVVQSARRRSSMLHLCISKTRLGDIAWRLCFALQRLPNLKTQGYNSAWPECVALQRR
ncbi:hypothetical protein ABTM64_19805, partial [Acinetobacter baumannii]